MKLIDYKEGQFNSQADPYVLKADNGKYYMYVTGCDGVHAYEATSLCGEYTDIGVVFSLTDKKEYWAPAVTIINGKYYMYVSCMPACSDDVHQQAMHVALSDTPNGPFVNAKQIIEPFSIDAHVVENEAGLFIFYSVNDYEAERAGTYVVVDFTGKNVPQIALFVDKVTSSLTDGNEGLYIHTGMIKKNGDLVSDTDGGRITFLGPNKMEFARPDAEGRVGKQFGTKAYQTDGTTDSAGTTVSPLSIRGLEDGVHYRYVVGIKTVKEESTTKGRIVLDIMLINLDTKQEVVRYEWSEATVALHDLIDGGNIIMYGRYNTAITLDKIYPVYTKIGSIYAIDLVTNALS